MNTDVTYLGIDLPHPFIPGASPMGDNLDTVKRLEDAGAAAIIMRSLFEEQFDFELNAYQQIEPFEQSFAEASSYLPRPEDYAFGPEQYLRQIQRIKETTQLKVIASLNGTRIGGWTDYAKQMQQAGADALELNLYELSADAAESSDEVESRLLRVVSVVRSAVDLPVAVKLSPYISSVSHFSRELEALGVNGLVLFNRFYQPDVDPETLEVTPSLQLSSPAELRLRLRWLSILSSQLLTPLSVTGGVHQVTDAVKAIMCGAWSVQVVSALLRHGPEHLAELILGLRRWLEEREYESLYQLRGSLNLARCPDPVAFERANYLKVLQTWKS
jgi:dihydroorotate dehydrogenase (fumarate)